MWAMGAGISTASAGPRPCTRAISDAFQLSPRCVCSTALGIPVEPEVNRTSATSEGWLGDGPGRHRRRPDGVGERDRVRERLGRELDHERGVDLAERPLDVGRAERVQDGRGHGADAPAGPGQDGGGQAVGHLPGHGLAPPTPLSRRPPATVATSASAAAADSRVAPSTISPPWAEIRASSVGHVPGTARPPVAAGQARAPRSVGGGPSRQGTIPGPR